MTGGCTQSSDVNIFQMNNWNGLKNKKIILKEGYLFIGQIQANSYYFILFISIFVSKLPGFQIIPIVHLEDVYITGLCASSCHLRCEHDKGFKAGPIMFTFKVTGGSTKSSAVM